MRPEQPCGRTLEDSFEESFKIGEHRHRSGNRTRGRPNGAVATGPTSPARGTSVRAVAGGRSYTLGPARPASGVPRPVHRGHHDGDPHRVVLRTVRHSIHLRVGGAAQVADRPRARRLEGPAQLRHAGREHLLGGDGGRPQRGGAERDVAPARRVPQDVQLLPDLPAVHLRQLLEQPRSAAASRAPRSPATSCRSRPRPTRCGRLVPADSVPAARPQPLPAAFDAAWPEADLTPDELEPALDDGTVAAADADDAGAPQDDAGVLQDSAAP